MIIVPENELPKKLEAESSTAVVASTSAPETSTHDPPPSYTPFDSSESSQSGPRFPLPRDVKPSNFTSLSIANSAIKGTWVVDPTLVIPKEFLAPLAKDETEENRKNLLLESKNGAVDVNIFVMPMRADALSVMKDRKRVITHCASRNGSVTAKIHDVQLPSHPNDLRPPLKASFHSLNGAINLYLPRSFRGPLRIRTFNGGIRFSDAVQSTLTQFSEVDRVRRSFLGHFDPSEFDASVQWAGDELDAETMNGAVRIYFDDEASPPGAQKSKSPGFLERLFRF
ncbi:hypothetical protein NLJ89_g3541 [Agrocybe chaxingu]|uniref:DUF7330 domain-containing protein n=1 Tax=Agrocybe chaxingu TaxID=84603 RepID=A0A9W8K9T2_9AGAR|nr:hypothetical protein NLJ89_g3541 [Agrocybe chaxingu]